MRFKEFYLSEKMSSFERKKLARKQALNLKRNQRKISIAKAKKEKKIARGGINTQQLLDLAMQRAKIKMKTKLSKGKPWALVPDAIKNKFDKWASGPKPKSMAIKLLPLIKSEMKLKKDRLAAVQGSADAPETTNEAINFNHEFGPIIDELITDELLKEFE